MDSLVRGLDFDVSCTADTWAQVSELVHETLGICVASTAVVRSGLQTDVRLYLKPDDAMGLSKLLLGQYKRPRKRIVEEDDAPEPAPSKAEFDDSDTDSDEDSNESEASEASEASEDSD